MKPKVFICSTIYDFRDLRSAIKYWIDEMGYEAVLSEYNDFTVQHNQSSYDACLKEIESCQYFILLIGARAGGYYDKASKTTITMMEYRKAYDLSLQGKINIIAFVRRSVWDIREDRKALKELILTEKILADSKAIEQLTFHESSIIRDTEIIFNFLQEIGRVAEIKKAIDGQEILPLNNWIFQFDIFSEVISTLKTQLSLMQNLTQRIQLANLKNELEETITSLFLKENSGYKVIMALVKNIQSAENKKEIQYITMDDYESIVLFFGFALKIRPKDSLIHKAISEGLFLNINFAKIEFTLTHRAALMLEEEIRKLNLEAYRKQFIESCHRIMKGEKNIKNTISVNSIDILVIETYRTNLQYVFDLSKYIRNRILDRDYNNVNFFKIFKTQGVTYNPKIDLLFYPEQDIEQMCKE